MCFQPKLKMSPKSILNQEHQLFLPGKKFHPALTFSVIPGGPTGRLRAQRPPNADGHDPDGGVGPGDTGGAEERRRPPDPPSPQGGPGQEEGGRPQRPRLLVVARGNHGHPVCFDKPGVYCQNVLRL